MLFRSLLCHRCAHQCLRCKTRHCRQVPRASVSASVNASCCSHSARCRHQGAAMAVASSEVICRRFGCHSNMVDAQCLGGCSACRKCPAFLAMQHEWVALSAGSRCQCESKHGKSRRPLHVCQSCAVCTLIWKAMELDKGKTLECCYRCQRRTSANMQ